MVFLVVLKMCSIYFLFVFFVSRVSCVFLFFSAVFSFFGLPKELFVEICVIYCLGGDL